MKFFSSPGALLRAREERGDLRSGLNAYGFAERHVPGGCHQLEAEIVPFLDRVRDMGPRCVCEIGCANGGTTLALSQSAATVELVIAVDLFVKNRTVLKTLSQPGQRTAIVDGQSLSPRSLRRIQRALGGRQIDVLLIDGDHSYQGALGDFVAYRDWVREGGLIAFHDIVADAYPQTSSEDGPPRITMPPRHGVPWSGDVPRLWNTLSPFFEHESYIADRDQHGFGIGVIEYRRARAGSALLDALVASAP